MVVKSSTMSGHLDILKNAIEKALDRQMYPPVEVSGDQEQYHVTSSWHSQECNWECSGQADVPPLATSGGQEQYYVRSSWHSEECNWESIRQADVPSSRGIWWPRAVLCSIILTHSRMQLRMLSHLYIYIVQIHHTLQLQGLYNFWKSEKIMIFFQSGKSQGIFKILLKMREK